MKNIKLAIERAITRLEKSNVELDGISNYSCVINNSTVIKECRAALLEIEENKSVGITGEMPGTNGGFSMCCFKSEDVPIGSKVFTLPKDLEVDIDRMVSNFLGWELPKDFSPDGGISFQRESEYDHPEFGRLKFKPIGTHLLNAVQAKAMIEHILSGVVSSSSKNLDHEVIGYWEALEGETLVFEQTSPEHIVVCLDYAKGEFVQVIRPNKDSTVSSKVYQLFPSKVKESTPEPIEQVEELAWLVERKLVGGSLYLGQAGCFVTAQEALRFESEEEALIMIDTLVGFKLFSPGDLSSSEHKWVGE